MILAEDADIIEDDLFNNDTTQKRAMEKQKSKVSAPKFVSYPSIDPFNPDDWQKDGLMESQMSVLTKKLSRMSQLTKKDVNTIMMIR